MRRILACIVALMVCATLVLPAAASTFTPSVTYKGAPRIVPITDADGNPAIGEILEGEEVIDYLYAGCLIITAVSEANTSEEIPDPSREMLLSVYEKLKSGEMKLPYEKLGVDASKMSIRDLFDATFICGDNAAYAVDHPEVLEPNGIVLRITFDLGVAADANVYTMTYKNNEWKPAVKTVNNGDGTVTCTFEKLCPVVFCVETSEGGGNTEPPKSGDPAGDNMTLWIVTAVSSLVAVAALVVIYRVKFSKK